MILKQNFPIHKILGHKNYQAKGHPLLSLAYCLIPFSQKSVYILDINFLAWNKETTL